MFSFQSDSYGKLYFQTPTCTLRQGQKDSVSPSDCYLALKQRVASCAGRSVAEVPNDLPSNIVTLDLGLNKITALLNDTFQRYRSLTTLRVMRNDLRCIELKALYPLTRLRTIDLSNNVNLILHTGEIFRFSQHLAKVNLMSCGLLDIPDNCDPASQNHQKVAIHGFLVKGRF